MHMDEPKKTHSSSFSYVVHKTNIQSQLTNESTTKLDLYYARSRVCENYRRYQFCQRSLKFGKNGCVRAIFCRQKIIME